MRTATRKLSHITHHLRRPRKNGHALMMNYKQLGKLYKQSIQRAKRKPLLTIGTAAVAISALSSLLVWYLRR